MADAQGPFEADNCPGWARHLPPDVLENVGAIGTITREEFLRRSQQPWVVQMLCPTKAVVDGGTQLGLALKCKLMAIGTAYDGIDPFVDRIVWNHIKSNLVPDAMTLFLSKKGPVYITVRTGGKIVAPSTQFMLTPADFLDNPLPFVAIDSQRPHQSNAKAEKTFRLVTAICNIAPTVIITAYFMRCVLDPNVITEMTLTTNDKGNMRVRHTVATRRNDPSKGRAKTEKEAKIYMENMDKDGVFINDCINNNLAFVYWKEMFESMSKRTPFICVPNLGELVVIHHEKLLKMLEDNDYPKAVALLKESYVNGVIDVSAAPARPADAHEDTPLHSRQINEDLSLMDDMFGEDFRVDNVVID